ncbi:MAG TPA: ATP-binding protein [Rhizomicrobium sp.]|nr:ATP-binding protein [Rhizomicrobium sp.]
MLNVLGVLTQQHDIRLVFLAALLCMFAAYTAVNLVLRAHLNEGRVRSLWTLAAGIVLGSGMWGVHFISMLAYHSAIPLGYDVFMSICSLIAAVATATAGFIVLLKPKNALSGGAVVGLGIAVMHYVGMLAVQGPFRVMLDYGYVVASISLGVVLCAGGAYAGIRIGGIRGRVFGAVVLGLAILAVHFTGMTALTLEYDPSVVYDDYAIVEPGTLAIAIASLALFVVALGLIGSVLDNHLRQLRTGEAQRLREHVLELEDAKSKLEQLSDNLVAALEEAAIANRTKSTFLAAMSHELRTPLNAVIGFSDVLLAELYGPLGVDRYKEYAQDIRDSGTHLLSLINDVLDLSRLDAEQASLDDDEFPLSDVVFEATRMVSPQAERAGVTLRTSVAENLPMIRADRRRIRQILLNLMSNAAKFTHPGGSVEVSAHMDSGAMVIAVADTGIGIAKDDIPKALERFGQVDSRLARKYQGTGLGLPLAKQLAELHGGTFTLRSAVGVGTTVTFTLPPDRIIQPDAIEAAKAA